MKVLKFGKFRRRESDQISIIRTLLSQKHGNGEKEDQGIGVNLPLKVITVTWARAEGLYYGRYRRWREVNVYIKHSVGQISIR